MKKILILFIFLLSGIIYCQEDNTIDDIKPRVSLPIISLNQIEIPVIYTDNIVFDYYMCGKVVISPLTMDFNGGVVYPINVSEEYDYLYDLMKPRIEWIKTKHDVFGDREYIPDGMTYYGWKWLLLQERENKEGFTKEIQEEWLKLFNEMKPYFKK